MRESMRSPCEESPKNEHPEGHAAATEHQAEGLEVEDFCTTDSHSALETEGAHGLGGPVAASLYLESCHAHGVVPASCLLRQGNASELNLRHRGLGPQGAQALASMLASNVYIKRLDLRDNGLRRAGAEALADVLCKNRVISDVDLSENQIGAAGLQAICAALALNPTVQKIQLEGNRLEEQAAQHLAALLLLHTGLKSLDLSYNQLSDLAGETLGPALAENTGLTELNLSWNHLRGPGAIAFARGLEANIFLKVLDISHNGFGDAGASAIGEALKANNVLEELNMRNNRISAAGALKLGLGLQVNQTLRILTADSPKQEGKETKENKNETWASVTRNASPGIVRRISADQQFCQSCCWIPEPQPEPKALKPALERFSLEASRSGVMNSQTVPRPKKTQPPVLGSYISPLRICTRMFFSCKNQAPLPGSGSSSSG